MHLFSRFLAPLFAVVFTFSLAVPAGLADYGGEGNSGRGTYGGGASTGLSNATTRKVVRVLTRDFNRCTSLDSVYRYDCYRLTYKTAADLIVGDPSYRPAFKALAKVEKSLETFTRANLDTTKPLKRKGFQQFKPITPAALPKAKAELTRSLEEAETVLLRSASDTGQVHFARIAEAVNSNKVLLRSLLQMVLRRFA